MALMNQSLMYLIKRAHGLLENVDIEKHRQSQDHLGGLVGHTRELEYKEITMDGMNGEWILPRRAHDTRRIILHCHGGGYSTGSCLYARSLTSKLALGAGRGVLCFDYRLAPEYPAPAALEDALKAWDYLMYLGYGARDVVITGDSAGGNLALVLLLKLREQGRQLPRGLVLMSPWTDLTSGGESFREKKEADPVLNEAYIQKMVEAYAGDRSLTDPYLSPLFGDLRGFPPTYIQVGDCEILLSDSVRLEETLRRAGVKVQLEVFEGMWHVFQMSPFKAAGEAMDKISEFIFSLD